MIPHSRAAGTARGSGSIGDLLEGLGVVGDRGLLVGQKATERGDGSRVKLFLLHRCRRLLPGQQFGPHGTVVQRKPPPRGAGQSNRHRTDCHVPADRAGQQRQKSGDHGCELRGEAAAGGCDMASSAVFCALPAELPSQ